MPFSEALRLEKGKLEPLLTFTLSVIMMIIRIFILLLRKRFPKVFYYHIIPFLALTYLKIVLSAYLRIFDYDLDEQDKVTALFHRGNLQLTQNVAFHILFLSPTFLTSIVMVSLYAVSQTILLVLLLKGPKDPMFIEGITQGLMITVGIMIVGYILHKRDVSRFLLGRKAVLKE